MLVPLFSQIDVAKEENIEEFIKLANEGLWKYFLKQFFGEWFFKFKLGFSLPTVSFLSANKEFFPAAVRKSKKQCC